jgi:hypothetical protein
MKMLMGLMLACTMLSGCAVRGGWYAVPEPQYYPYPRHDRDYDRERNRPHDHDRDRDDRHEGRR